jgi:hypothetical protein
MKFTEDRDGFDPLLRNFKCDERYRYQNTIKVIKERDICSEIFFRGTREEICLSPNQISTDDRICKGNMENLGRLVVVCTNSERFMTVRLYGTVLHLNTALMAWLYLVLFQNSEHLSHRIRRGVAPGRAYQRYEANGKY